ncbi:MAG: UDP-N-acetylglucosamine 2-epimerase, partial [Collinsella sp.]
KYDMPILYSCHPRSRKRLEATGFELDPRVRMHEPMGFHDYNCLQMNAFAVVSDSGTLPEESSFFASVGRPFPAVCIRTSTERPEALDKACFTLAGISERGLLQAVHTAVELDAEGRCQAPVPDYADETVSPRWSRSSRATPASWTRWCGGRIFSLTFIKWSSKSVAVVYVFSA